MKRYYLSDVIGDGSEANPYRPAVVDALSAAGESCACVIASGEGGRPAQAWSLVVVNSQRHAALALLATVRALPDAEPDEPLVNRMTRIKRLLLAQTLEDYGVTIDPDAPGTVRQIASALGRRLDDRFDLAALGAE